MPLGIEPTETYLEVTNLKLQKECRQEKTT